jgi:hypothetical protein
MVPKRQKALRIIVMVILALLALQFEFGMAVTMSDPPAIPPFGFSQDAFMNALHGAGGVALIHADLGAFLVVFSVVSLVLSLRSGMRSVQVFGSLAFLAVLLAGITGQLFVQSGFQNDGFSHGMATNFILSFAFYFLELYFLKPAPKTLQG